MLLTVLILLGLSLDKTLDSVVGALISRGDAIILLLFLSVFVYYLSLTFKIRENLIEDSRSEATTNYELWKSIILVAIGILLLFFGGRLAVSSAISLTDIWGISQLVIGTTIVAIGTSLPELATVIVAQKQGYDDISLGNIIGSNIINIVLILAMTALINPLTVSITSLYQIVILATASFLFWMFVAQKNTLSRYEGYLLLIVYLSYLGYTLSI